MFSSPIQKGCLTPPMSPMRVSSLDDTNFGGGGGGGTANNVSGTNNTFHQLLGTPPKLSLNSIGTYKTSLSKLNNQRTRRLSDPSIKENLNPSSLLFFKNTPLMFNKDEIKKPHNQTPLLSSILMQQAVNDSQKNSKNNLDSNNLDGKDKKKQDIKQCLMRTQWNKQTHTQNPLNDENANLDILEKKKKKKTPKKKKSNSPKANSKSRENLILNSNSNINTNTITNSNTNATPDVIATPLTNPSSNVSANPNVLKNSVNKISLPKRSKVPTYSNVVPQEIPDYQTRFISRMTSPVNERIFTDLSELTSNSLTLENSSDLMISNPVEQFPVDKNGFVKINNPKHNRYSFISSASTDVDFDWFNQMNLQSNNNYLNLQRNSMIQQQQQQQQQPNLSNTTASKIDNRIEQLEQEIANLRAQNMQLMKTITTTNESVMDSCYNSNNHNNPIFNNSRHLSPQSTLQNHFIDNEYNETESFISSERHASQLERKLQSLEDSIREYKSMLNSIIENSNQSQNSNNYTTTGGQIGNQLAHNYSTNESVYSNTIYSEPISARTNSTVLTSIMENSTSYRNENPINNNNSMNQLMSPPTLMDKSKNIQSTRTTSDTSSERRSVLRQTPKRKMGLQLHLQIHK
ncbi:hypothetical protein TBLA_0A07620 [Henningerozyma blattae CBS 6284]|uniref:Uncharacterized protein n=1 Tax=Henningerozyma blattae (strain ATCC 34711 / CBS 6284 / DSM 70876 / NBRC 10599 / NRRL Y-10934 / UCD 77-7) TaxID=1071380 RepID=I2GWQ0_HENB6|nr:hypothetical protein TBLA_0A07620 [Tetrapisispora blattae CBS 6284]CCH58552.1 hypothetical protein TBLA_0A07620 [Tetrapisispora blattae CBS 6284]